MGVALILSGGCRTAFEEGGKHALPPIPPDKGFSDYKPDHPYLPLGNGVAKRSVFTTTSPAGLAIDVQDFLVAPGHPAVDLALAGGAVLEVRQGTGEAVVGEEKIELRPGLVVTVGAEEFLRITARGEPLALRAWIASPGRREP